MRCRVGPVHASVRLYGSRGSAHGQRAEKCSDYCIVGKGICEADRIPQPAAYRFHRDDAIGRK